LPNFVHCEPLQGVPSSKETVQTATWLGGRNPMRVRRRPFRKLITGGFRAHATEAKASISSDPGAAPTLSPPLIPKIELIPLSSALPHTSSRAPPCARTGLPPAGKKRLCLPGRKQSCGGRVRRQSLYLAPCSGSNSLEQRMMRWKNKLFGTRRIEPRCSADVSCSVV